VKGIEFEPVQKYFWSPSTTFKPIIIKPKEKLYLCEAHLICKKTDYSDEFKEMIRNVMCKKVKWENNGGQISWVEIN
jgi:hypothetical protein